MEDYRLPIGVHYPVEDFVTAVRTCKCGVKYRVDHERAGFGVAMQLFQHCPEDEGFLVGLWLGVYEQRDGKWVATKI